MLTKKYTAWYFAATIVRTVCNLESYVEHQDLIEKCDFYIEKMLEQFEIDEEESLTMALDMILEQKFIGFDKYFKIRGFETHVQAYASFELLLEVEKLPDEFHSWFDRNSAALSFLENIRTENYMYIN